jgi:hypothetical protein
VGLNRRTGKARGRERALLQRAHGAGQDLAGLVSRAALAVPPCSVPGSLSSAPASPDLAPPR